MEKDPSLVLPAIEKRRDDWHKLWNNSAKMHYVFGGLLVLASSLAAIGFEGAQFLAAIAAVLTALIGFVNPERRYLKFVRPWRKLDTSLLKFHAGIIEIPELINELNDSEKLITGFEDEFKDK